MWIVALIYSIGGAITFLISGLVLLKENIDFNRGFMNQFYDIIMNSMLAFFCALIWPFLLVGSLLYFIGKQLDD